MSAKYWFKMLGAGGLVCIGGPWLVMYVTPTEQELFKRYNPDLQRRSLENRAAKQQEFDTFAANLRKYSKSDKPIWTAWEEDAERKRQEGVTQRLREIRDEREAAEKLKSDIRNSAR